MKVHPHVDLPKRAPLISDLVEIIYLINIDGVTDSRIQFLGQFLNLQGYVLILFIVQKRDCFFMAMLIN